MENSIIRAAVFAVATAIQLTGCANTPESGPYSAHRHHHYYGRPYYRPPGYFVPRRDYYRQPPVVERHPTYISQPDMYPPDRPAVARLNPPTHYTSHWITYPNCW